MPACPLHGIWEDPQHFELTGESRHDPDATTASILEDIARCLARPVQPSCHQVLKFQTPVPPSGPVMVGVRKCSTVFMAMRSQSHFPSSHKHCLPCHASYPTKPLTVTPQRIPAVDPTSLVLPRVHARLTLCGAGCSVVPAGPCSHSECGKVPAAGASAQFARMYCRSW